MGADVCLGVLSLYRVCVVARAFVVLVLLLLVGVRDGDGDDADMRRGDAEDSPRLGKPSLRDNESVWYKGSLLDDKDEARPVLSSLDMPLTKPVSLNCFVLTEEDDDDNDDDDDELEDANDLFCFFDLNSTA